MATKPDGERALTLDIAAAIPNRPTDLPTLVAYAFTSGGGLVASQPLDARGLAKLTIPISREPQALRVVVGPEILKDQLDLGELLRRGGIEKHIAIRPNMERLPPLGFDIGPAITKIWLQQPCLVKGTLLKRVISGGITLNLPVCHATIDIYEVDPWPWIIAALPEIDLDRLREIIDGPWPPIGLPTPPRPWEHLGEGLIPDRAARLGFDPQPDPPGFALRSALPAGIAPSDLKIAARAARPAFERALVANLQLIHPILCWRFPHHVTKQKIATVTTDDCGRFHTTIWKSYFNPDQPDLYFIARQKIWPGFWVTIHEKLPVACYTWWNYACGTEVTLITTHPLAHACAPCPPVIAPNNWVLFMAIGNSSVWRIHGANDTTWTGAPGYDATRRGLLDDTAPWGGSLRPRLEFDSSLRSDLGVRYYRVSYKRPSEPETAWRPSTEAINRHYTHEVGGDLILEQYPLGPTTVGTSSHLCEIPPALPPTGAWSLPNAVLNTQNAVIPTTAVAPGAGFDAAGVPTGPDQGGLWQIGVELFNAAGVQVDPELLGIKWRVPISTTLTGTIATRNAAAIGLVDSIRNRMVVTVRVDNNPSLARIGAPALDGTPAGSACGVMTYASRAATVTMPFDAVQRNRFATSSLTVVRGAGPGAVVSASGTASASIATPPPVPSASVDTLLGTCNIAGFSENLYIWHMATDGWSRQSDLDSSAVRAFVLAPTGSPGT